MTNAKKRILTSIIMLLLGAGIVVAEAFGIRAVRIAAVAIVAVMIFEYIRAIVIAPRKNTSGTANILTLSAIGALLLLMLASAWFVGGRPWIILLLLLTISCADIGAWFFGQLFGNDKMWERLSPGKTWAGQIAGILCGTAASIMYGLLGSDTFFPQLLWIGISVSLLSQYGDLTASWIKRKLNIKDFGHILPGHGGVMDRFDGWIYVLPIIWMVML